MEIPRSINPKHLIKSIPPVLAMVGMLTPTLAEAASPSIDLKGSCLPNGRVGISVQAKGFERFTNDFAKLYLYAADLTAGRGYILIGYDPNPDTITAGLQGQTGDIQMGQGSIDLLPGHRYSFMVRRGGRIEDKKPGALPYTDYASEAGIDVHCGTPDQDLVPKRRFI